MNNKRVTGISLTVITLIFIALLGPRIYILSIGLWEYIHTDVVCTGINPTPPPELGEELPFFLDEVKPYTVVIDDRNIYPGEEYEILGEKWLGLATLIWAGNDGAVFTISFASNDPTTGYSRPICRWFIPKGNYR